jgi:hypothetical protein
LVITLLQSRVCCQPGTIENLFQRIHECGWQIKGITVGEFFEPVKRWSEYNAQVSSELAIAYQHQQLSFRVIEGGPKDMIVLHAELMWSEEEKVSRLRLYTDHSAMFTMLDNLDGKDYRAQNAQRVLGLAKELCLVWKPGFAWIDRCRMSGYTSTEDVNQLRIPHIYWGNFFGPSYVREFGEGYFLNAPGLKVARIDGGGVLYVLSPDLTGQYKKELVERIKAYFDVDSVRC